MFRSHRYERPWTLTGPKPPRRIERSRLVLRCWEPDDALMFERAFGASREHVGAWIPRAWDEPSELDEITERLAHFRAEFHAGTSFIYAILDPMEREVWGEVGLMPRLGQGVLEIGYWVHVDQVGRGIATDVTRALTRTGLALPEVHRIEIHCHAANKPSAAVPRRLGYQLTNPPEVSGGQPVADAAEILVFALEEADELPEERS